MSTAYFFLTPFTLSVLNVAIMLTLLVAFLVRIPEKSPATRSLMLFLIGVDVVFAAFIYIFSSLDLQGVTQAWWLLHAVIFFIPFLMRFAYSYPQPHFDRERRRLEPWLWGGALLTYVGYLYHTSLLEPIFAPGGYLFVYLGTPEIGIVIGAMLAWTIVVFWRTLRDLQRSGEGNALVRERQASAIRKLILVLFSPVALLASIVLAYQGMASWELVAHLLGSGVMLFLFIFTVIYINNSLEPTTLLIKIVGLSLGAILLLLGASSSLTMSSYKTNYLAQRQSEVARIVPLLAAGREATIPEEIVYIADNGRLLYQHPANEVAVDDKTLPWESGWVFREGRKNQPDDFYIAHLLRYQQHHYEIGYSYLRYREHLHSMVKPLAWLSLLAALFVLAVFPLFFRLSLFNPLRRLLDGVAAVDQGRLDVQLPVATYDEIGRLTYSFNHMTGSVRDSRQQLRSAFDYQRDLTDAYSRFVPKEILTTLNKKTILEVGLGDSVQKTMTVLFSDIRSFTTLSERMSPGEVFDFINHYLERVGPVVRRHGGYIDKYIGDAVMALFPNGAEAAVAASIEMQEQVRILNRESSLQSPIRIGIGIHTGELMLGTIGERERMEGTVISDAVNLASRLEGITKLYDSSILISHSTFSELPPHSDYQVRLLDRVRVRGKSEWIDVYEVIDGDVEERREIKRQTLAIYQKGLDAYRAGRFMEALGHFEALSGELHKDPVILLYQERCRRFIKNAPPSDWDGAISVGQQGDSDA